MGLHTVWIQAANSYFSFREEVFKILLSNVKPVNFELSIYQQVLALGFLNPHMFL